MGLENVPLEVTVLDRCRLSGFRRFSWINWSFGIQFTIAHRISLSQKSELHQVGESKISHPQIDRDDQRYQNHDGSLPDCALASRPLNTFKFGLDVNKLLPDSI